MTDVTKLDWRRWYSDRSTWPIRTELFLAEAVLRMAPLLIHPWDDIIAVGTMADEQPVLPGVREAFRPDGTPIPEIHAAWAPAILDYMSAAEFTERQLKLAGDHALMAAQKYDPASKRMIFDPAKAYTSGTDVSYAHWGLASGEASEINELRGAGVVSMPLLARAIAELAKDRRIRTIARPIASGEPKDLQPEDWLLVEPVRRIASCGINLEEPLNPSATPTHLVFVDPEGFDVHVALYAQQHMIALQEEGLTPADAGITGPKGRPLYAATVNNAYEIMKEHMRVDPVRCQKPVLREVVEKVLGSISNGIFDKARTLLIKDYPHIAVGGAPVGKPKRQAVRHLSVIKGGKPETSA